MVLIGLFRNGLNWLNAAGQYIEVIEFHYTRYVMLLPILDFPYSLGEYNENDAQI